MQRNGRLTRLAAIATVALLALTVVPVLASTASAASTGPSAAAGGGKSVEWAYGGEGWNSGGFSIDKANLTWNTTVGVDVVLNATNTSSTTTELKVTRTVVVSVRATYDGPSTTWKYSFKAAEDDLAYANLTDASSVRLDNGTTVAALGLLNASLHANATLAASLVGTAADKAVSDYLNASGWAKAQVSLVPALGLVPLNLTGVTGWTSTANASGSAAWNVSWNFVNHGWNGTTASRSGDINGTWSAETPVTLYGEVAGTYAKWIDHRLRTAVGLSLHGPFDLYAGVLLIPHAFDLFNGASRPYAASGIGTGTSTTEYLYLSSGTSRYAVTSLTAANMSAGTPPPTATATGGPTVAVSSPQAGSPGATVWAQPESPQAAESQATCLQYGCSGGGNPLGGYLLPLLIVAVAAVVAIGLVFTMRSRGRGGRAADVPLSASYAPGPTPPTGSGPSGPAPPTA